MKENFEDKFSLIYLELTTIEKSLGSSWKLFREDSIFREMTLNNIKRWKMYTYLGLIGFGVGAGLGSIALFTFGSFIFLDINHAIRLGRIERAADLMKSWIKPEERKK